MVAERRRETEMGQYYKTLNHCIDCPLLCGHSICWYCQIVCSNRLFFHDPQFTTHTHTHTQNMVQLFDLDVTQRTAARQKRMRQTSATRIQAAMRRSLARKRAAALRRSKTAAKKRSGKRRTSHLSKVTM